MRESLDRALYTEYPALTPAEILAAWRSRPPIVEGKRGPVERAGKLLHHFPSQDAFEWFLAELPKADQQAIRASLSPQQIARHFARAK